MDLDPKMKILIVDDMPNMRKTIKNMLRSHGFENLIEASDGEEGASKLKAGGYSLVISDWNMPKMTGIQFLRQTRDDVDLRSIPFLMVTAEITEEQIAHAAETEVDGYVIKPFNAATLKAKIESVMERKAKPSPIDAIINLSKAMIDAGQGANAVDALAKALKQYPKSARLLTALGETYETKGDDDNAIKVYEKAKQANPLYVRASQRLGDLYIKKGEPHKALKYFKDAATVSPNDPSRQLSLGKLYLETGDKESAKEAFSYAQKVDDTDTGDLHKEIGEAFMDAGMEEYAVGAFKRALDNDPNMIHIYNRLGIALRRKGRFEEAVEEYKKALKIEPQDEALYFNLTKAYMEKGDKTKALEAIQQALKIDPGFKEARDLMESIKKG